MNARVIGKRHEFKMTDEQKQDLLKACRPVPYMIIGGHEPASPQENANNAWRRLGDVLGFDGMTVQPVPGKDMDFFTAIVTEVK